jgi:rod shape-determining protein MreB
MNVPGHMSFLDKLTFSSSDLAIDLGTANTVIYARGKGIVLAEPSVLAMETIDGIQRVLAVGDEAKMMIGKTPDSIKAIRPLRHGVISDLEVAEEMIKQFIRKAQGARRTMRRRPQVVISIPSGSTSVERRAMRDAASNAGAGEVWLIDEAMAAAIGAGLPVTDPVGSMIVDIGGGTTEVGVISVGGMHMSMSAKVGGDAMDEAIASHVRRNHNLLIGEASAEEIKKNLGTARTDTTGMPQSMLIRGRDLTRGVPAQISISQVEITHVLADSVGQIVQVVRTALENTAPEVAADIMGSGFILAGGGSLLRQLDSVLADQTGLAVSVADDPLNCVALGAGRALEDATYQGVLQAS